MKLILASGSLYRKKLLDRLGVDFEVHVPQLDESQLKQTERDPMELAQKLALAKATEISNQFPEALVIGSDQLVSFEGQILGKPGTEAAAIEQLLHLNGKSHELLTAVAVGRGTQWTHWVEVTRMTLRQLHPEAIERYVKADQPLDCAGSYKIESRGIALFTSVVGADPTAIEGLPLMELADVLSDFGFKVP